MRLGIGERQTGAPGSAEQLPAFNTEMPPDPLHVGDEIPGRVFLDFGMRRRAARAALIEYDDPVSRRIVKTRHHGVRSGAGPAMDQNDWLAVGIAEFGAIDFVDRGNL